MEEFIYQFFLSIGMLSLFSLLGALFSAKLRQPAVIGLIFIGMLVGPNVLGIVHDNQIIELLAELGATLLLFSIGVEFSIPKIFGQGLKALIGSTLIMGIMFIIGYEAAVFMGFDFIACLAIGASFSFSSTTIFVRLMQSYGLMNQPQVPFLISILVIEDIVAVFAMAFFSSLGTESANYGVTSIATSLLFSLAIMGFAYLIINKIARRFLGENSASMPDEQLMLLSLGFALLMAFFATAVGLSAAVGAFIAGSVISGLPIKAKAQKIISPLILAFSSYFFLSIGLMVSPVSLYESFSMLSILTALFIIGAFCATAISAYLIGFRSSEAITAGASMVIVGEFSLLVGKEIAPAISSFDLISVLAAMVFATTIVASFMISMRVSIASYILRLIPHGISFAGSRFRDYFSGLISRLEGNALCAINTRRSITVIATNAAIFTIVASAALVAHSYILHHFSEYGVFPQIIAWFPIISIVLVLPLILLIVIELKKLADSLTSVFLPDRLRSSNAIAKKAFTYMVLLIAFFVIFISIPAAVQVMQLPSFFAYVNIVPLFGIMLILWDIFSAVAPSIPLDMLKNHKKL